MHSLKQTFILICTLWVLSLSGKESPEPTKEGEPFIYADLKRRFSRDSIEEIKGWWLSPNL